MKKSIMIAALMVASLGGSVHAQQMPAIPVDSNVRIGQLENGLTYYIRHNDWPEKRADFYIAQKVGSMQEEDEQRGLAHFLEHMCFNGTTHFPGDGLKSYLESIGVKFGENLNAYTSFDETVYNVNNVPVISNPASLDSCLLILHDWSHDLLLEGSEIDKERGVINEEWRMRSSAQQRLYEKLFPVLYEGSRYAYRMPIGTMDIVMNFPYKALRDYYHKWYRPDLQSIIIVGDVDVDLVEQKIRAVFADVKAVNGGAVREAYPVMGNSEPIIAIGQDKEQTRSMAYLMWKQETVPTEIRATMPYLLIRYMKEAIGSMFDTRFSEIAQKADAPFIGAGAGYGEYVVSKTMDAFQGAVMYKDNGQDEAIKAFYREILRANRFGFTPSEYERFRNEYKSQLENEYQQRDKIENTVYAEQYYRHFLDGEPIPGIEWEYQTMPMLADGITVDIINQSFMSDTLDLVHGFAMMMMLPEKDGITVPEKEHLIALMNEVQAEEIEAYRDEVSAEPLVDAALLKGSPVRRIEEGPFDSRFITLKNGVRIYFRQTDYQPNNINMSAHSWGGNSLYSDSEFMNSSFADNVSLGGWGNFSAIDLGKKLAGIQASCAPSVGTRSESLTGHCVTKDFETLMQLIYLQFTAPRKDMEAYTSAMERMKTQMANAELQPITTLRDSIASVVYSNDIRHRRRKAADLDRIDYDRSIEIYRERFANAADFDFFFVGDIDLAAAQPLMEKYLGSLPVRKGREMYRNVGGMMSKGQITNIFQKKQETPMAYVLYVYQAEMEEDLQNVVKMDILSQVMDIVFTASVREDEGGAYSMQCDGQLIDYPEKIGIVQIVLPTAPEKRAAMTEVVYGCIQNMMDKGPEDEDLQKVKEYMLRSHEEALKTNSYWLGAVYNKVIMDRDFTDGYEACVNSITAEDIREFARKVFNSGNHIELGMTDDK